MTSNRKQIKDTERDKLWYSTREFFRQELINWMGVKIAECHNNIRMIKPAKNASRTWQLTDRFSGISSLMKPFSVSGFCSWLLQKEQPLRFLSMLDLLNYKNISKDRRRRRRSLTEGVRDYNKNKNRSLQQMQISRLLVSSDLPRHRPLLAKMRDVLDEDDVQSCRGSYHLSLLFNAWCVCVCARVCVSVSRQSTACGRVWSISSPHSSTNLLMR